jgi:hypothetical protein
MFHRFLPVVWTAAFAGLLHVGPACAQPAAVAKTNSQKVFMHYMPWFETPATLGGSSWGYHWKFNNRNPNVVDANGRRDIASHYYPLIGPYASRDPDVIEYHLLLMKLAGVDGVLIDWYGQAGTNGDVASLLTNSNALIDKVDDFGMQFGVILEDRFAGTIANAKTNVAYLRDHYFNNPAYIRLGAGDDPLLGVFGPITFQTPSQWTEILGQAGEDVNFATLWYEKNDAGANADGEYAWIYQDAQRTYLQHQSDFYNFRAPALGTAGGAAFPGFNDFYQEGGVNANIGFEIPHNDGQTLASLLTLAGQKKSVVDFLQLATFNDFGEGTMFEPTVETQFDYLEQVQDYTGVAYGKSELELVYRLYRLRKEFSGDATKQAVLSQAATHMASLELTDAKTLLDSVALRGDFDRNGIVDGEDVLVWQGQLGSTGLYPLASKASDANADGVVDDADLAIWREDFAASSSSAYSSIPEPATWTLAILSLMARQRR